MLINDMVANGQKICIATSSGNTGAALAAYSAAAGIVCIILVVDGAPVAKLRQMQLYGAKLLMVQDFGKSAAVTEQVFKALTDLVGVQKLPFPVSAYCYCPEGMKGVETISTELMDELSGDVRVFVPAGGGGLTLAVSKGMMRQTRKAKVHCVQPEGNDTIASSLRNGVPAVAVARSTTQVSGLQVANVLDGNEVIEACIRLGGTGHVVSDENVFKWHRELAYREGIFSEPAGAVALAGVESALLKNEIDKNNQIVCLVTGSGFKDMASVDRNFKLEEDIVAMAPPDAMSWLKEILNNRI